MIRFLTIYVASMLLLQQGMIPVVDTKSSGGPVYNACLISGWAINEGSLRFLHDVTANANTGLIQNVTPTWGSNVGFPGSSLSFTPVGSNFALAGSTTVTNFTGSTPFSLAAWVSTTATANQVILSSRNGAGTGWEITSGSIGTSTLEFVLANGSNVLSVHGSTTIVNNGKHYVVATYDGTGVPAGVKLYVDGAADTVTTVGNTFTGSAANGQVAGIGTRPGDANGITGVMAGAAIYNCVLTPTQVSTYNGRGVQVN